MKKKLFLYLVIILGISISDVFPQFSDINYSNWFFGNNSGLNFDLSKNIAKTTSTSYNTWEGTSVLSDSNGKVLLYSDGSQLFDAQNNLIADNLGGNSSSTQSAIFVSYPSKPNLVFLFVIGAAEYTHGYYYSLIDLNKINSSNPFVLKKVLIDAAAMESLTAKYTSTGDSIWVVSYNCRTDNFLSLLITDKGLQTTQPILSKGVNSSNNQITGAAIKFSPDGNTVAFAHHVGHAYEIYNFNQSTGILTIKFNLKSNNFTWPYGVEFSPSGDYLYGSQYQGTGLYQFNLTLNDPNEIVNKAKVLSTNYNYGSIQLGPDGKIYIAKDNSNYLETIDYPDKLSPNCLYNPNGIKLNGTSRLGLPQLPVYKGINIIPMINFNSPLCVNDNLYLTADSIVGANYYWEGPDGFTSNLRNPIIKDVTLKNAGTYYLYFKYKGVTKKLYFIVDINENLINILDENLIFSGSATKTPNNIKLTNSKVFDAGSIFFKNKYSVKNDWTTTFKFKTSNGSNGITYENSLPGADGFGFIMQKQDSPFIGSKGGYFGYGGLKDCLVLEIDLFENEFDPNGNHISIQTSGSSVVTPLHDNLSHFLAINSGIPLIEHDKTYFVKIDYNSTKKELNIYLDTNEFFLKNSMTISNIDFVKLLNLGNEEGIYFSICSATGEAFQEHYVWDWKVSCISQPKSDLNNDNDIKFNKPLTISPNPAYEKISINLNSEIQKVNKLIIYNEIGEITTEISPSNFNYSNSYELDISHFNNGIYFIEISNGTTTFRSKFIKLNY